MWIFVISLLNLCCDHNNSSNEDYNEEKDPLQPDFELDDFCEILKEFLDKREEKMIYQDLIGNPALKKKSNF